MELRSSLASWSLWDRYRFGYSWVIFATLLSFFSGHRVRADRYLRKSQWFWSWSLSSDHRPALRSWAHCSSLGRASLFIATNICETIVWKAFSLATCQHWTWNRVWRSRDRTLPSPRHQAGQVKVLDEPWSHLLHLRSCHLFPRIQCGPTHQECSLQGPVQLLPHQAVLYLQHLQHPAVRLVHDLADALGKACWKLLCQPTWNLERC